MTLFLTFSPLTVYGAPLQTDGSTATTLGQAGNGVPVVNIANPNASGLSHNRFTSYNVNANGLILNNATTPTVTTQLGGVIGGNTQLTNNAKVILNEVTSTNRSSLNGYTEVAGPRADLVIANPNGLTINGAGFINTGRVTLSTGRPVIVGGALQSLNVTGGDIAIQGTGLNTQGQTSTAIYTQYLNLNAKVHAQNLDVKLGGNSVNYATGVATSNAAANARTVLLDASALGGMYANRITLVGTDAGLGVNLPPEVLASTGDIIISNDGTITLQKISAATHINVTSVKGVNLTNNLYSGANATITAGTTMNVSAGVVAGAKHVVTINANQLSNAGTIIAGLNADGTQNTTGLMNITAATINNTGDIQSTGNLLASGTTFTNDGVFNAGNDLTLSSTNLTNNKTLFAGNNMNLYTTGTLRNTANSNIFSINNLTMSANAAGAKTASIINNQADIQALNGTLNVNALDLQNITTAPIIAQTSITVGNTTTTIDSLQSRGKEAQLLSGGNMSLNADTLLNNYSLISAGGNINVTSNALTNQFVDLIKLVTVATTTQKCTWNWTGTSKNCINVITYTPTSKVIGSVTSTLQAGGNITGNVTNLNSLGINANQVINATPTAFQKTLPANNRLAVNLPVGTQGLFVVSTKPSSSFLIVTNPKFAIFGNFISSSFLLNNLNFSSDRAFKRLGDAFYETQLIRNSVFAQTGRRFLNSNITSDNAQYQYLMDNALAAQEDLELIPGVSLTHTQIAALKSDIVWLEEQTVAGQQVLVPIVYIANADSYKVEGGAIVAGNDINLLVDRLNNAGLMEAGNNLDVQASDSITNQKGSLRAGNDLSLTAQNDIKNISALIAGKNITLVASNGNIINQRQTQDVSYTGAGYRDSKTLAGLAGNIVAKNSLSLKAKENITIAGSKLKGKDVSLAAKEVEITTTVKNADAFGGDGSNYIKLQSTTHLASNVEGENIAINTSGKTTVRGSNIKADKSLRVTAKELEIASVNNSSYFESKTSHKGFLSKSETTTKQATSTNIASNVSGGNVTLSTINDFESTAAGGDINVTGSNIHAQNKLALDSAGNINVQAGFDGTLDETQSKKSGWFTGGALFSKSEDLEGKLTKTAALANLSGGNVSLNANKDIALVGVNVVAEDSLTGRAENITVENVNNEEKTYSKHTKLTVSVGAALKNLTQPQKMVKYKDGKLSATLAKAEYSKADKVTTKTEVVSSNLAANNISLTASSSEDDDVQHSETGNEHGDGDLVDGQDNSEGNITIKGSNLTAKNDKVNGEARGGALGYVNLTADGDVNIIEAKNTEKTASKEVKGTAELKVTVKNEYVQIAFAVKAAKDAKDNLQKSKSDYSQYKRDLGKQRGKLIKLKADLANGRIGIEQADVDEMAGLIDDLRADDAFYKANIALAVVDLATKTLAVVTQMSTAATASATYGFSASLELDIDVLEKKFAAYKEQSVGSNITAQNININADNTATIRGSNLNANDGINIDAGDTNILASQDVNNSSNSKKHAHLNISYGTAGGSVTASADSAKGSSRGITNTNSQLVASNIHINTGERTTIAGANISASDKLSIETKNLDVASVQDSNNSRSNSRGFSISGGDSGITGGGVNGGMSHSRQKQTVLTTLNGNQVDINTEENTTLRGAMVAAVDNQGNDNGNLTLKTDTLEVSSLNNRRDSKSMSMGINVGISNSKQKDGSTDHSISSVGIDFANDRSNSKTKTLGTIGEGSIEVASVDNSNTRMLNRDIKDSEIDIYDIQSHRGLKGTVDVRMFTKKGRAQITEELTKSGMILNTIKLITTDKTVGVQDFFSETDKSNKTYEAVKEAIAKSPALAKALQNPDLTPKQKESMLNGVTSAVMLKLGYKPHKNLIVANANDPRAGHISAESGTTTAYINDTVRYKNSDGKVVSYVDSTGKLVIVTGHETSHAIDAQSKKNYTKGTRESYATNYGENLASYTNTALSINGYGGMATSNSHTGNRSEYVTNNTAAYNQLDKAKGDDFLFLPLLYTMLTGAAVGAGVDVVVQGASNAAEGKPIDDIDGKKVLVSGVLGAVGGGVAAVVGKAAIGIAGASKLGQPGTVVVEKTAEIIVDSGTSVVSTLVKGEKPLTFEGVAQDVIVGQLGGAFGKTVAKSKTPSSSAYIHAKSEADRAARMASPTKKNGSLRDIGRPKAKQAKANAANAAIKELIDGNATRGGIVGAGAGSAAADIKDKLSSQGTGGDRK